jgi:hypothetical protein
VERWSISTPIYEQVCSDTKAKNLGVSFTKTYKVAYHQTNNNNSVEVVGSGFWVLMSTLQGLCVHSVYPKAILLDVQYKANLGRVKLKG